MKSKKLLGASGELAVADYLIQRGYTILERNITYRGGEVDLIAQCHTVLAFIEVKTRSTAYFALSSIITPQKQAALIRAAHRYLATHAASHHTIIRFDVAIVEGSQPDWKITYYPNAFTDENSIR